MAHRPGKHITVRTGSAATLPSSRTWPASTLIRLERGKRQANLVRRLIPASSQNLFVVRLNARLPFPLLNHRNFSTFRRDDSAFSVFHSSNSRQLTAQRFCLFRGVQNVSTKRLSASTLLLSKKNRKLWEPTDDDKLSSFCSSTSALPRLTSRHPLPFTTPPRHCSRKKTV